MGLKTHADNLFRSIDMVDVPEEIREVFTQQRVIPMATCSLSGVPNVAYVGMWW